MMALRDGAVAAVAGDGGQAACDGLGELGVARCRGDRAFGLVVNLSLGAAVIGPEDGDVVEEMSGESGLEQHALDRHVQSRYAVTQQHAGQHDAADPGLVVGPSTTGGLC